MNFLNRKNIISTITYALLATAGMQAMQQPVPEKILFANGKDTELLEQFSLKDKNVKNFLYQFLHDEDVKSLFFKLPRNIALLEHWIKKPALKQQYLEYCTRVQGLMAYEQTLINNITRKYNATVLSVGSCYVLVFRDLKFSDSNRNVLIKVQRVRYPLLPDIRKVIDTTDTFGNVVANASNFQLLSRLVYYQKVQQVIAALGLTHIRVPRKFLFPRPFSTLNELQQTEALADIEALFDEKLEIEEYVHDVVDNNYIIVEEYIHNPRTAEQTWQSFATLNACNSAVGKKIFTEMEFLIPACGLWSFYNEAFDQNGFHVPNIFLVENDTAVAFIDLEKPGFGDPDERDVAEFKEARLFHPRNDWQLLLNNIRNGALAAPFAR
jgi:hypothetical protein